MKLITIISNTRLTRALALAAALLIAPAVSSASVFVSVNFAPPPIPVYEQPYCPGADYIWVPGYWAWGPEGFFWVPGYWVLAPFIGALWTPGWWGWGGVAYVWHPGYWGRHVGYYGGINYGFGYFGVGYSGGYWSGGHFSYNSAVTRVDVTRVRNVYAQPVQYSNVRVSYNGGQGGVRHAPTAQERIAEREPHRAATTVQIQHERSASTHREQFASVNHGSPGIVATPRVNSFQATTEARVEHGTRSQGAQVDRFHTDRGATQNAHPQARTVETPHANRQTHEPQARSFETPHVNRPAHEPQARNFEPPHSGPPASRPETFRAERNAPQATQTERFRAERSAAPMHQPQTRTVEAPHARPEMAQPQTRSFEAPRSRPEPHARSVEAPRGRPEMAQPQARSFEQPHGGGESHAGPPQERVARGGPQGRPEGGGRHEGERRDGG